MKIFNTMTRRKEEFVPVEEGKVKMYVCGPTVYNFIHIGNARPMIVFDTVRRYFEYKGYDVNYVSNFTDVDDKIINKAIEEHVSADEISKRYIEECKKDMEGMNIKPATKNPLATEEICGMVEMIRQLIDKGYAYEKNGTVYFRTRKFEEYGKLSHKNLDDLRSGNRTLLVSGKTFAKYWMHNAFLNIDNHKMSKSLGNFRTVREISEQYDLQILRFFMLSAHYRSPLNFSAELMEASRNGLERIVNAAENLKFLSGNAKTEDMTEKEKTDLEKTEDFVKAFEAAMDDDFNTADAIASIFDLVKYCNTTADGNSSREYTEKLLSVLQKLADVMGLIVNKKEEILDEDIEALIEERQAARKAKDFARADQIRDELAGKGIILEDTREGVKWKRA